MSEKVCQYCKGVGQIRVQEKKEVLLDKHGKPLDEYSYYTCFCVNNKLISNSFNKLRGVPDITLEDAKQAGEIAGLRNLLISGSEQKFLHLVKSTMVLHANYPHTFEFLNGVELVQKYYVEQPEKVTRSLLDLEEKSLVIFIFDACNENKAQSKAVFEVIKNRWRMNNFNKCLAKKEKIDRPTWVYAPNEEMLIASKEYSQELKPYLENFDKLDVSSETYKITSFEVRNTETSGSRPSTQDSLGM
jgi:hypothetical protein